MYRRNLPRTSSKPVVFGKVSKVARWIFVAALLTATKAWADDTVPLDPQLQAILDFFRSLWRFLRDMIW